MHISDLRAMTADLQLRKRFRRVAARSIARAEAVPRSHMRAYCVRARTVAAREGPLQRCLTQTCRRAEAALCARACPGTELHGARATRCEIGSSAVHVGRQL